MRKLLTLPMHPFSIRWSNPPNKILTQLQYESKSQPFFIKDHGVQIINHLCDLSETRQWKSINNLIKTINLGVIDQWALWGKLSECLSEVLSSKDGFKRDGEGEEEEGEGEGGVEVLVEMLYRLRYQPKVEEVPALFQYVENALENSNTQKKIQIGAYFIAYNPQIFRKYQKQLQSALLSQLSKTGNLSWYSYYLFGFGTICQFWSQPFLTMTTQIITPQLQTTPSIKTYRFQKYLHLPNPQTPTTIQPTAPTAKYASASSTQQKVSLLLADLGYIFDKNVYINGTEVDLYFGGCRMIVEFEGTVHYRINGNLTNGKIQFIRYIQWKRAELKRRGFLVVGLPFYQWNKLEGEKAQKLYLINRIEKMLMHHYNKGNK